jgi:hypothetical protein
MEATRTQREGFGLPSVQSNKVWGDATSQMEISSTGVQDVYEIRPCKDREGFDLVSDCLRRGPIWYAGPDAVRNAIAYAKYRSHSRSRPAIIRVLDEQGTVTETHKTNQRTQKL